MPVPSAIIVEDLHVHYGAVAAVRGVSLRVSSGELVALVGPNGAGKSSTLLAIAGGLVGATVSGSVKVGTEDVSRMPPEHRIRCGLALVPEGRRIFGRLTVRENLLLGATALRERTSVEDMLKEMYERFPVLEKYQRRSAGMLSGGEQQQLAIARALMSRPNFLLLDEPSLGLAPMIVEALFSVLLELRKEQIGILLVEQNAMAAIQLADRAYVMANGVLHDAPPGVAIAEMRELYQLVDRERTVS